MKIEELLYEEESSTLDFKEEQYPFINEENKHKKSELLKDILAFANAWRRDDAYILIGVREIKGSQGEVLGIEQDIDDATLQEFINGKTNRPIEFEYKTVDLNGKNIAYIKIFRQNRPFFVKKDYGKVKANTIYLRRGSSTAIATPDEIYDMGKAQIEIETIYKNPVNYRVVARLVPISIDIENEINVFKDSIKKASKEIKKIKKIDINSRDMYDSLIVRLGEISTSEYNKLLVYTYKKELENYIDTYTEEMKSLEKYIEVFKHNKYFLDLSVENIGNTSDTNIDISIKINDGEILKGYEIMRYFTSRPKYPKKPKKSYMEDSALSNIPLFKDLNITNPNAYRKNEEVTDNKISVILRDMNVGDSVKVVNKKLSIEILDKDLFNMSLIIKSKESTSKIMKDVEVVFEDEEKDIHEWFYDIKT